MVKRLNITLPEWVVKEILGKADNKSSRIYELLIKGYMSEKIEMERLKNKSEISKGINEPLPYPDDFFPAFYLTPFNDFVNFAGY
jgi:hypothetical protein